MNMADILTIKGKPKLLYDGKLFVFEKMNADMDVKFWRCEQFNTKHVMCKARLHTDLELERELPQELQPILEWFISNYTGRPRLDGVRSQPKFDPAIWNVHQRTVLGLDRTNNFCESAHRRLQRIFGCDHPSVWRFVDLLRMAQKNTDAEFAQFIAGHQATKKRQKFREADRRILELIQRYTPVNPAHNDHQYAANPNHQAIIEFLQGISYNYNMNP